MGSRGPVARSAQAARPASENTFEWIGQRIAARRVAFQMTQQDLSDKVGLGRAQVANIEAGRSDMPLSRFLEFCEALECTADELLDGWW